MAVLVVLLALAVAVLAVVAVLLGRGRTAATSLATTRGEALDVATAEVERLGTELTSARADRDRERARADAAEGRARRESSRAEDATASATAARAAAAAARTDAEVAASRARDAESGLDRLRRALDPPGLWAFERQRLCRVWHDWVSVTIDGPCPLPDDPNEALTEAVAILAAASREECGVPVDVTWELDEAGRSALGVEAVLVLLRAVEELIAAARGSNGAELSIAAAPSGTDELELRLTPEPARPVPAGLADSSAGVGWDLAERGGALVLHIPAGRTAPSGRAGAGVDVGVQGPGGG